MPDDDPWASTLPGPQTSPTASDGECQLCGAPGGYPYCNTACQTADQPDPA